jgi:hypothetical protein
MSRVYQCAWWALLASVAACRSAPTPPPAPAAQNPSPMRETTRRHERLERRDDPGVSLRIDSLLPAAIDVFIPERALGGTRVPLLIHFQGSTWVPQRAVATMQRPVIVAAALLGAGSSVYARPFVADSMLYARLLDTLRTRIAAVGQAPTIGDVYLSGWSAGYGAIRQILRRRSNWAQVQGVLLIDGMHASYIPGGRPLADGGVLDTMDVTTFAEFARAAVQGEKRFLVTHSEIFPGTYASTTECADWLLQTLGIPREPVLEWGPMGTQLLSRSRRGRFEVLGFAGNSAPDHVDQFHGMATFVERLLAMP